MIKKILLAVGVFVGLLFVAMIVVPLVVDVDKYRPEIVKAVNEQINGRFEMGQLKLSLWGKIKIDVDGLKVTDAAGRSIVEVKDVYFNLPFSSIFSGKPELRLEMTAPMINVIKGKDATLNVMKIAKAPAATPGTATPTPSTPVTPAGKEAGKSQLPPMVLASRLTFLIDHAQLFYKDEMTGDSYKINNLSVSLKDVSPSRKMPFEISADLDLLAQKKIKVVGPLVLEGWAQAHFKDGVYDNAEASLDLSMDKLSIDHPGTFTKASGVPLGVKMDVAAGKDAFSAKMMQFRLADIVIDARFAGKTQGQGMNIDFKAESNKVSLAKMSELLPSVKGANLNGVAQIAVRANGPTDKLDYAADVKLNKMMVTHESMQQPLEVNASLAVVTDELKDLTVLLNAKNFDMKLNGKLQSFTKPRFKFTLSSNTMDVDGLMKPKPKPTKEQVEAQKAAEKSGSTATTAQSTAPATDYNAMFDPLRENAMAAGAGGTFDIDLKHIKSSNVVIKNFKTQFALNNLLLAMNNLFMEIFDGTIKGNMTFNVKPKKPEVGAKLTVAGLQIPKMIESQSTLSKDTVKGVISSDMSIGGPGLNTPEILNQWRGGGHFTIKDAVFSTLDMGKQVKEGVIDKLPEQVRGKVKADQLSNYKGEYETFSSKFAMGSGVFAITEIVGKAYPRKGLDLRGNGTVGLNDYALDLKLDIIDMYNLLNADDWAKDARYGHFAVSTHVLGSLMSPRFDWGTTVKRLAENAFKTKGKEAAKKLVESVIKGEKPQEALKKILGGGGGQSQPAATPAPPPPPPAQQAVQQAKKLFGR